MTCDIRNATYSDHRFLCEAFGKVNDQHIRMRGDLYRKVDPIIPKWKFAALVFAKSFGGMKDTSCLIAEKDGQSAGAVFLGSELRACPGSAEVTRQAYLDNIVVLREFRPAEIGKDLVYAAKQWARDTGHHYMYAKILENNERSIKLSPKVGFNKESFVLGKHIDACAGENLNVMDMIKNSRVRVAENLVLRSEERSSLSWSKFPVEARAIFRPTEEEPLLQSDAMMVAETLAGDTGHSHVRIDISCDDEESLALLNGAGYNVDHVNVGMPL